MTLKLEVLGLDVAVEDGVLVAGGHSLAHLRKHGRDQAKAGAREQLRRVEGGKKAWCWRGARGAARVRNRRRGRHVDCGRVGFVVVAGLFEKIEKIFTGYELEKKKQERRGLEGAMKRDDVGVGRERLMNRGL